jgi:DNA-binding MarR family transcriptional regulator
MGTLVRDEAAILKALERKTGGIRSTDLLMAVRATVRSPTTFQKRLKHLHERGRIRIEDDLNDMRVKIINSTPKSEEASRVLEVIDLLERVYLGKTKPSQKTVKVTQIQEGELSGRDMQWNASDDLLELAYETYLKLNADFIREGYEADFQLADLCIEMHRGKLGIGDEDEEEDADIHIGMWPKSYFKEWYDDSQRFRPLQAEIMKSTELTRLVESKGFVVDKDGVRPSPNYWAAVRAARESSRE